MLKAGDERQLWVLAEASLRSAEVRLRRMPLKKSDLK